MFLRDRKGILVFEDKGGKFSRTKCNIINLTGRYDIKVNTQDNDGVPVALTFEISDAGTLDRTTHERKEGVPVLYGKTNYNTQSPNMLFNFARSLTSNFSFNKGRNITIDYRANSGIAPEKVTREEYEDVDYYSRG